MSMFICSSSDFHPFECSHDRYCEHCTLAKTDKHDPNNCALCDTVKDDNGKTMRLVDDKFATQIRVLDLTERGKKIAVSHFSGKRVDAIKWLQSNGKDLR